MRPHGIRTRSWQALFAAVFGLAAVAGGSSLAAQANPYTDSLLARVRALGHAVPGALPVAVRYLSVLDDSGPESDAVEGAPHTPAGRITPAFQIRYPQGWIMVDAAQSRAAAGRDGHYHQDNYDRIRLRRQKPDSTSRRFGEDRVAIGEEIAWLHDSVVPAGIALVVSHDASEMQALVRRGVLSEGLDLGTP